MLELISGNMNACRIHPHMILAQPGAHSLTQRQQIMPRAFRRQNVSHRRHAVSVSFRIFLRKDIRLQFAASRIIPEDFTGALQL